VPESASAELAEELKEHCRAGLGPLKVPRHIDFEAELPRHQTGKLYKQALRQRYVDAGARPDSQSAK
jgi:long-chain acyl-CoA synthetase